MKRIIKMKEGKTGYIQSNRKIIKICLFLFFTLIITAGSLFAQSTRSLINDGVDKYKIGNFTESENNFKKALDKNQELFEGHFNLGDAFYKSGKYDQAVGSFRNSLGFTEDPVEKAKVFHNIGNSFLKSQKYEESIDAYKNALKLNPVDDETKYNLSYALNMLKQQQQQNKQNKNKDKDKNKDQDKKDQQDQNQNKNDQNNQDKNKDQKDQQKQQQQQQQQKNQISKNEAERILAALKNKEADLQKKLRQQKGRIIPKEKDW